MSKHTPGPWRVNDRGRGKDGAGGQLARFWVGAGINGSHDVCAVSCQQNGPLPQPNDDEAEANARLIAAAPELLEAAQWCLKMFRIKNEHDNTNNYEVGMLERVIAKATGGEE